MSAVTTSTTQPMAIPWLQSRRAAAARLIVSLERRVSVTIEDRIAPVVDPDARVLTVELVALLAMVTAKGRTIEQKRVRARGSDALRFADAVLEQMQWACHTCPGVVVDVSHDASASWQPLIAALPALPSPVRRLVGRVTLRPDELELARRIRR
jgi:hypothetical protein